MYSAFEQVPIVFYHANFYWKDYAKMDMYNCPLDGLLYSLCIWRYEDMVLQCIP